MEKYIKLVDIICHMNPILCIHICMYTEKTEIMLSVITLNVGIIVIFPL